MTTDNDKKARPPRFLLNMPDELRQAVERAAFAADRPVTAEINRRLQQTFDAERNPFAHRPAPTPAPIASEATPSEPLGGAEQALLEAFRRLSPDKQLALLSLLR